MKAFKGTIESEKAEEWTSTFWWEAVQRTNFVGRQFDIIIWVEFMDAFNDT